MIRLTCPVCQSKLNAKEGLAGQTRKCPKCGNPLVIPATEEPPEDEGLIILDEPLPPPSTEAPPAETVDPLAPLAHVQTLERLNRQNRYLVCDRTSVFATWQNNGQGWMLRSRAGNVSAARNPERLPAHGNYTFVELAIGATDEGPRLSGLHCFKLAEHWALTTLDQGDDRIVSRITGSTHLGKEQKVAVRQYLAEAFMREVWQDARDVLDYLTNAEYRSPGMP
ncbi:MAG: hypothetical protein ABFD16_25200 [Thermoguttaceae bacterium]